MKRLSLTLLTIISIILAVIFPNKIFADSVLTAGTYPTYIQSGVGNQTYDVNYVMQSGHKIMAIFYDCFVTDNQIDLNYLGSCGLVPSATEYPTGYQECSSTYFTGSTTEQLQICPIATFPVMATNTTVGVTFNPTINGEIAQFITVFTCDVEPLTTTSYPDVCDGSTNRNIQAPTANIGSTLPPAPSGGSTFLTTGSLGTITSGIASPITSNIPKILAILGIILGLSIVLGLLSATLSNRKNANFLTNYKTKLPSRNTEMDWFINSDGNISGSPKKRG